MLIRPEEFTRHPPLVVLDGPDPLHIGFDDLLKYHGLGSIGGVAIAFRVMAAAFMRLSPDAPLDRRKVAILTAFPGPGAADAFEMAMRARSDERYRVDTELAAADCAPAAKGRYFFQFTTPTAVCALGLQDGVVFPEFVDLVRQSARNPLDAGEAARLRELKFMLARRVLQLSAAELLVPVHPVRKSPASLNVSLK